MMNNPIIVDKEDGILAITFTRPGALNALDWDLSGALQKTLSTAEHDKEVGCVVLRGINHFMAGGALKWFAENLGQPDAQRTAEIERFIDLPIDQSF